MEKDSSRRTKKAADNLVSTAFIIVLSIVCILFSISQLFMESIKITLLWYLFCGAVIFWGVVLIAKYFVKKLYLKYHEYSFSTGILCIILGCCGLVRSSQIIENVDLFLGLIILMIAIVLLQNAIRLRAVMSHTWLISLIIACASLLGSVVILFDIRFVVNMFPGFIYWILLFVSILNIVSFPIVSVSVWFANRREAKAGEQPVTEVIDVIDTTPAASKLEKDISEEPPAIETDGEADDRSSEE